MPPDDSPAPFFGGAFPIGNTNILALPVKHIGPAAAFYTQVLGFTLVERGEKSAMLKRDDALIGLTEDEADPDQASVYFSVSNLKALHAELAAKNLAPGTVEVSEHDNKPFRVFFAREPYGVCFCFGHEATD